MQSEPLTHPNFHELFEPRAVEPERLLLCSYGPLSPSDVEKIRRITECPNRWEGLEKLADGPRSSVAKVRLSTGVVVVKRYIDDGLLGLRGIGRRRRAEREANALARVAALLPDNPVRVLGWGSHERRGLRSCDYLITTFFEGSFDLRRVAQMDSDSRGEIVQALLADLPRRIAILHSGGLHLRTLRGKNVLFEPTSRRIALIDLPYARAGTRVSWRRRRHDLATISLELRRFVGPIPWLGFVNDYLWHARDLSPEAASEITVDSIDRAAARIAHRTPWSAARRSVGRRLRHSRLSAWLLGQGRTRTGTPGCP